MANEPGKAVYTIFTSPHHAPQRDHLPTLIVTPAGRPQHVLYIYMHTNFNQENYLLTPSDAGDLCVAKLFPPPPESASSATSSGHGHGPSKAVRCEASRNLKWSIVNTGVAMPTYKLTLPNPDGGDDQPLFQISKTNKHSPFWLMTYYTYAGHLIPPNRIEFGRIEKSDPAKGGDGGTRVIITGKTDDQKAVWKTLGGGNEDMVEWCVLCGALNVIDDEVREAARQAGQPYRAGPSANQRTSDPRTGASQRQTERPLHPTGRTLDHALAGLRIEPSQPHVAGPTSKNAASQQHRSFERNGPPPNQGAQGPGLRSPSPYQPSAPNRTMPPPPSPGPRPDVETVRLGARPVSDPRRSESSMPPAPTHRGSNGSGHQEARPTGPMLSAESTTRRDPRQDVRPQQGTRPPPDPRYDPRAYTTPPLGYDSRGFSTPPLGSYESPRNGLSPAAHANSPYDPRGTPPIDSQPRTSRGAPPASMRSGMPLPSPATHRPPPMPSPGASAPLADRQSPRRTIAVATEREYNVPSGYPDQRQQTFHEGPRHESQTMRSKPSASMSPPPPEHRRQTGREAVSYQPGARHLASTTSPNAPATLVQSPKFPASPERTPARGFQLQDIPASRAGENAGLVAEDPQSIAIKAQRAARARHLSNS